MKAVGNRDFSRNYCRGFTLVEMLVSMAILTIVVALLGRVFGESATAFNQGMRRSEQNLHGRAIVDFIARELGQAIINEDLVLHLGPSGVDPYGQVGVSDTITFAMPGGVGREVTIVQYDVSSYTENRGGFNVTAYQLMRRTTTDRTLVTNAYGRAPLPNPTSRPQPAADGISGFAIRFFNRDGTLVDRGNISSPPAYADIYLAVLGDTDLVQADLQGADFVSNHEMVFVTRVYMGYSRRSPGL